MISEPYICIKGWNIGSIYWLAKHPDGELFALSPRHNSCDLVVYDQVEWKPYADFEREMLKKLKGFLELSALESLRAGYSFYFIGKGHRASYSSEGLIDYRFYDYEDDSESNRLLKRAEFLKAVCEKEGIPWTEEKGECRVISVCTACEESFGFSEPHECKKANQGGRCGCRPCHHYGDYEAPFNMAPCGCSCHQKPSEEERHPMAIGLLKSSVTAHQTQGLYIVPKGIKFILKHGKYSEILEVKELVVSQCEDRKGFAHPSGAVVEVSFDPGGKFL